jgi:hypothetical protein
MHYPFDGPATRNLRAGGFASRRYRRFAASWNKNTNLVRQLGAQDSLSQKCFNNILIWQFIIHFWNFTALGARPDPP